MNRPVFGDEMLRVVQQMSGQVPGSVGPHGAELPDLKGLFVLSYSLLLEQDGAGGFPLHRQGHAQQHRGQHHDAAAGQQHVQARFTGRYRRAAG